MSGVNIASQQKNNNNNNNSIGDLGGEGVVDLMTEIRH